MGFAGSHTGIVWRHCGAAIGPGSGSETGSQPKLSNLIAVQSSALTIDGCVIQSPAVADNFVGLAWHRLSGTEAVSPYETAYLQVAVMRCPSIILLDAANWIMCCSQIVGVVCCVNSNAVILIPGTCS